MAYIPNFNGGSGGGGGGGGGGAVTSVFGRAGVVIAEDTDYSATQILTSEGQSVQDFINSYESGNVISVFGRTGAIVAASGDYSAGLITTTDSSNVQTKLNTLASEVAAITAAEVSSVFGRTGAVVGATGDYTATNITTSDASNVQTKLNTLASEIATIAAGEVTSVFGRSGVVVATAGDYSAGLISTTDASNVQTKLNTLTSDIAAITAGEVTSVFGRNGVVVATTGDYTATNITTSDSSDVQTKLNTLASEIATITSSDVTSVFGRSGVVVATSGDYTASLIPVAASGKNIQQVFTQGEIIVVNTGSVGTFPTTFAEINATILAACYTYNLQYVELQDAIFWLYSNDYQFDGAVTLTSCAYVVSKCFVNGSGVVTSCIASPLTQVYNYQYDGVGAIIDDVNLSNNISLRGIHDFIGLGISDGADIANLRGSYNASTNIPDLTAVTPVAYDVWVVSVAGTTSSSLGTLTLAVGDGIYYTGSAWQKAAQIISASMNALTAYVPLTNSSAATNIASQNAYLDLAATGGNTMLCTTAGSTSISSAGGNIVATVGGTNSTFNITSSNQTNYGVQSSCTLANVGAVANPIGTYIQNQFATNATGQTLTEYLASNTYNLAHSGTNIQSMAITPAITDSTDGTALNNYVGVQVDTVSNTCQTSFIGIKTSSGTVAGAGTNLALQANGNVQVNGQLQVNTGFVQLPGFATGSEPTAPAGSLIYNTTSNKLSVYTGSAWEIVTSV